MKYREMPKPQQIQTCITSLAKNNFKGNISPFCTLTENSKPAQLSNFVKTDHHQMKDAGSNPSSVVITCYIFLQKLNGKMHHFLGSLEVIDKSLWPPPFRQTPRTGNPSPGFEASVKSGSGSGFEFVRSKCAANEPSPRRTL